jgi:hypothetical protein
MGIVSGGGKMYSAMSPSNGIGYGSIDGSDASIGSGHVFYRLASIKAATGNTSDLSGLLNPNGG